MNKSKKTIYNFLYESLSMLLTILLGLIIPRLTLVNYGSETNGLLNSVYQLLVYLALFESGVQMVALQSLYQPVSIDNREKVNAILSAINKNYKKTGLVYLLALTFLALIYPLSIRETNLSYIVIAGVVLFSGLPNVILFLFQGKYKILLQAEGKNYVITNSQTIITVLTNILKIILLALGVNIVVIVFGTFVLSLLQALIYYFYFKKKYQWINLKTTPDYSALMQKNSALIHQIAGMIFQNTDMLLLTYFCGLKVVSVYSLYKLVISHINAIINIPFNSVSFALGQAFNTNTSKYEKMIDVVETFFSSFVFAIYNVVLCLIIPFIKIYTKGVSDIQYVDAVLPILFVSAELLSFIRLPMLKTINYAGKFKETLPQTIFETLINIIVSLFTVSKFGIYGVLIGTIAALLYRTTEIIIYANIKILKRKPWKTFSVYIINLSVLLCMQLVYRMFNITINSYLQFFFYGILFSVVSLFIFMSILGLCYSKETRLIIYMLKTKMSNSNIFPE